MKRNTGLNRLTLLKSKSIKKIRPCTRTTKSQIFVAKSQVNIYNKKPKVENDDETSISKMVQNQSTDLWTTKGKRFF